MALQFSDTQNDSIITLENFLGVDYDTFESQIDLKRSNNAKNMIVNQNGYVEKRTGYKRVFANETITDRINGIFTYHAKYTPLDSDNVKIEDIHIIHIGTKLYKFEFENNNIKLGDELYNGMEDKKSRSFELGDSMYIIGAGYVKVGIDKLTKQLYAFKVSDYGKETTSFAEIPKKDGTNYYMVTGRTPNSLGGTYTFNFDITNPIRAIEYVRKSTDTNDYFKKGDKLLLGKKEYTNSIAILGVYYTDGTSTKVLKLASKNSKMYEVVTDDDNGLYIKLNFVGLSGVDYDTITERNEALYQKDAKIIVVFSDTSTVYSPLGINNRTPMWISGISDDSVTDNSDPLTRYTGQLVEGVNLLGGIRSVQFYYNANTKPTDCKAARFYLEENAKIKITKITFNDFIKHYDRVDFENDKIYANEAKGYVDLATSEIKNVFTEGTITIYYVKIPSTKDASKDEKPIDKCTIFGIYGGDNDTRVFVSGNPEYPCRDYASGLYDGTFFSASMWTDVGGDTSRIIGYHKLYSNQIILKDGNGSSATQYLRSYSTDNEGKAMYSISQGNDSYSASCISSFKNIGGYPYYIGEDGLYVMYGTNVKSETNTACKSLLVNKRFTKEDTENMICIVHEGLYYAYINKQMYVCDTLRESEWYYFDGLPEITCLWEYKDYIYFGDANGKVYRFMKAEEKHAYCDDLGLDFNIDAQTKAIEAVWTIPQNAYGSYTNYKTVRNLHISCMPYDRSSVTIYYNSDEDLLDEVLKENIDMFFWDNIDFERFSFVTIQQPQAFATRVKLKNIYTFGITLENKELDEPFGFIGLTLTIRQGKKVK